MRNLVKLFQLVVGLCVSDSFVVITPKNKAVIAGQRMEMECRTDSDWFVRQWTFSSFTNPRVLKQFDVYNRRHKANETLHSSGFGINMAGNGFAVFYSNETKVEHAGIYTCRACKTAGGGEGPKESLHSAALIVFHSEPACETNTSEDNVVIQCKVRFRGDWYPTVEWKHHGTQASKEYLTTNVIDARNDSDRTITSSLLISLRSIKGDSFFSFKTYFEWNNNSLGVDATNIPDFNCTWSSHSLSTTCNSVLDNTTDITAENTGEFIYTLVIIISVIFFMVALAITSIGCIVVRAKTAARNRTERNSNSETQSRPNTERIQESDGDRINVYNAMNGQGPSGIMELNIYQDETDLHAAEPSLIMELDIYQDATDLHAADSDMTYSTYCPTEDILLVDNIQFYHSNESPREDNIGLYAAAGFID